MTQKPLPGVPDTINQRMHAILEGVVLDLSGKADPSRVKEHHWYDEQYVGRVDGKIAAWRGYSVNLRPFGNYRTLYMDYVTNHFSFEQNTEQSGSVFAHAIRDYDEYVCLFLTSCSFKAIPYLLESHFTYKQFKRALHPSCVFTISMLYEKPNNNFTQMAIALLNFQRDYCV